MGRDYQGQDRADGGRPREEAPPGAARGARLLVPRGVCPGARERAEPRGEAPSRGYGPGPPGDPPPVRAIRVALGARSARSARTARLDVQVAGARYTLVSTKSNSGSS